jgi:hypothetical protein
MLELWCKKRENPDKIYILGHIAEVKEPTRVFFCCLVDNREKFELVECNMVVH